MVNDKRQRGKLTNTETKVDAAAEGMLEAISVPWGGDSIIKPCQECTALRGQLVAFATAALDYDKAIEQHAGDPDAIALGGGGALVTGADLDALYFKWREMATAALSSAAEPPTVVEIEGASIVAASDENEVMTIIVECPKNEKRTVVVLSRANTEGEG